MVVADVSGGPVRARTRRADAEDAANPHSTVKVVLVPKAPGGRKPRDAAAHNNHLDAARHEVVGREKKMKRSKKIQVHIYRRARRLRAPVPPLPAWHSPQRTAW